MMAHKQMLHELLKEDQEPFQLKSYIQDRQSQLNKSSQNTTLQLRKRNPIIHETSTKRRNLCKHACFLSFQNSPDVRKSPFLDFSSPAAKSPCKSPKAPVFLHIPSRTAALLVEAAMKIQKQPQQSKPKNQMKNVGFGLLGSFLRGLKDRSKNKKRAIGDSDIKILGRNATKLEEEVEESVRISCSCSNRRLSSADWTEENNEDKSFDFEASTSSCGSECSEDINDFCLSESRFCTSPFRFSLHKSPSSSGGRTPEFSSPAGSPSSRVNQEKANSDNTEKEEEDEKEQCSPVSVLDPRFEDDDAHESRDADEDDYDLECSYENVQRAKQQLLHRLRRFEKLAELDPMELERKLLEGSDEEREEYEEDEPFVSQVLNQSSTNLTGDMKRLVSDLILEEKSGKINLSCNNEVVVGRICKKLESWKEVEFNTIDMMIGLDLKTELDGWTKFGRELEEVAAEVEVAIYGLLVEELSEELMS